MGLVANISYGLFESDLHDLDRGAESHLLDGEVRVDLSTGESLFVSWSTDPVMYCVGIANESFFDSKLINVAMSNSSLWRGFLGRPLQTSFLDDDHQVLRLNGPCSTCYISSQQSGNWELDVITVSRQLPPVADAAPHSGL